LRHWRCDQPTTSAAANTTLCMSALPFISRGAGCCRPAIDRSPQPDSDDNPHRLYCSIVRSHERPAHPPVADCALAA
jgi:hypothetical protein